MNYKCLKCGKARKKKFREKTYKKKLFNGKIKKVPICCNKKMEIVE